MYQICKEIKKKNHFIIYLKKIKKKRLLKDSPYSTNKTILFRIIALFMTNICICNNLINLLVEHFVKSLIYY